MLEQEYVTNYVFENSKTGELRYAPQTLLLAETEGEIDVHDVINLLYCTLFNASKLLGVLWKKGFLVRTKKQPRGRGKPKYIYELTQKGEMVCNLLHKKGY